MHHRTAGEHRKAAQVVFDYLRERERLELSAFRGLVQAVDWQKVEQGELAGDLDSVRRQAHTDETGNRYAALAAIHESRKSWGSAQLALAKAFEKGQLDDPHAARLMLAQVFYHSGNLDESITVLESLAAEQPSDETVKSWFNRAQKEDKQQSYVAQHLLQSALP